MKTVGILAFQGGIIEHEHILKKLGVNVLEVRSLQDLKKCHGIIIPGGESTTIGFFLHETGLDKKITELAKKGLPIYGTCAGAILLAKDIKAKIIPPHLGLIDITIERNAYGTQIDSFTETFDIPSLKFTNFKTAFIRAPKILRTFGTAKILARRKQNNDIILVQQDNILVSTFHPELVQETRLHKYFLNLIKTS